MSKPMQSAPLGEPLDYVEAELRHLTPGADKPAIPIVPPGERQPEPTLEYAKHRARIHDGRTLVDAFSLDKEGLALVNQETAVKDFFDEAEVEAVYYREVEKLLKDVTGAFKVVVFDHTRRVEGEAGDDRDPVHLVHNDYTPLSGPQRVRDLLEAEEAEALMEGRFAIINVWRSIAGTIESRPLAVADAQHMKPEDFIATDLVYSDRVGEIYNVAFNPDQRWYYFPKMVRNEVLLLKCYDSALDGTARFTAHTAFHDPTTPAEHAPRKSMEIRTLVFYPRAKRTA